MEKYIKFATIKFMSNFENPFNNIIEIMETLLFFVIYWYVFRTLYQGKQTVDGITCSMAVTAMLLSIGFDYSYYKGKMYIQEKMRQGTLLVELIKPVDFRLRLLFEDMGKTLFFVVFRYLPVFLIAMLFANLQGPKSSFHFILFFISVFLGYIISWLFDFVCNEMAFFTLSVWGIVSIKNALIDVFGGVFVPVWFLPVAVRRILVFTPVLSIYYIPVNLYFGLYDGVKMILAILYQILWIVLLGWISDRVWKRGIDQVILKGAG